MLNYISTHFQLTTYYFNAECVYYLLLASEVTNMYEYFFRHAV